MKDNFYKEKEREVVIDPLEKIEDDISLLLSFVSGTGSEIPEEIGVYLQKRNVRDFLKVHSLLCELVAPATPDTIRYLKSFRKKRKYLFARVPLVRNFSLIGVLAIVCVLFTKPTESTNCGHLIFLSASASIGTLLYIVSVLIRKIENASLSQNEETYYWIVLFTGVLSGVSFSEMLSMQSIYSRLTINQFLVSLLIGFFSEIILSILIRVTTVIKKMVKGN